MTSENNQPTGCGDGQCTPYRRPLVPFRAHSGCRLERRLKWPDNGSLYFSSSCYLLQHFQRERAQARPGPITPPLLGTLPSGSSSPRRAPSGLSVFPRFLRPWALSQTQTAHLGQRRLAGLSDRSRIPTGNIRRFLGRQWYPPPQLFCLAENTVPHHEEVGGTVLGRRNRIGRNEYALESRTAAGCR